MLYYYIPKRCFYVHCIFNKYLNAVTTPIFWFLLGIAFLGIEVATMAFVLIFFAFGSWAAAGVAWYGANLEWQIAVFMLCSPLTLFLLRQRMRTVLSGRIHKGTTATGHPLADKQGVVSKAILPGAIGEICIGGSFWRATANCALEQGTPVQVLGCLSDNELVLCVARTEKN